MRTARRWTAISLAVALTAVPFAASRYPSHAEPAVRPILERKNVLDLSPRERQDFVSAVHRLKRVRSPHDPSLSWYDQFVAWHVSLYRCSPGDLHGHGPMAGHGGAFFLPWHRAFLHLFEQALNRVWGRPIAVPYWDWIDPASRASVFADDFMGGDGDPADGYVVTTGPFRKGEWPLTVQPQGVLFTGWKQPHLVRKMGTGLPVPPADVAWALDRPAYDVAPYDMTADPNLSFRNALEGWWRMDPAGGRFADPVQGAHCGPDGWLFPGRDGGEVHNQVHTWTGGVVADPAGPTVFGTMLAPASPNDPVFFLHHANVDRLWAAWQRSHGPNTFEPRDHAAMAMDPFLSHGVTYTPNSVLDVSSLGYRYAEPG